MRCVYQLVYVLLERCRVSRRSHGTDLDRRRRATGCVHLRCASSPSDQLLLRDFSVSTIRLPECYRLESARGHPPSMPTRARMAASSSARDEVLAVRVSLRPRLVGGRRIHDGGVTACIGHS